MSQQKAPKELTPEQSFQQGPGIFNPESDSGFDALRNGPPVTFTQSVIDPLKRFWRGLFPPGAKGPIETAADELKENKNA